MSAIAEEPTLEHPAVGAPDLEARAHAIKTGNINDLFDDTSTDNTAAHGTSAKDEGLKPDGAVIPDDTDPDKHVAAAATSQADLIKALQVAFPQATPPKEEVKQLTKEEIDAALNAPTISDEDLAALDNPETKKATLMKLLQGAAKNGATMASVIASAELAKLQGPLNELRAARAAETASKHEADFFGAYPTLNDDKLKPIVTLIAGGLSKDPTWTALGVTARGKKLAEACEVAIKGANPTFVLTPPTATQTKPKPTVPRQAVAATAGGGGAASHQPDPDAGEANRSLGTEIFD